MISKELSEILDALTRETGEAMLPCQELALLGFDPFGRYREAMGYTLSLGEVEEEEGVDYDDYNTDEDGSVEEEYEFDEDDEEYSLLAKVLRLNNCRKKYFA